MTDTDCTDPRGHIWVTLENAIDRNGLEVWKEEKCEFCDEERVTGVKP